MRWLPRVAIPDRLLSGPGHGPCQASARDESSACRDQSVSLHTTHRTCGMRHARHDTSESYALHWASLICVYRVGHAHLSIHDHACLQCWRRSQKLAGAFLDIIEARSRHHARHDLVIPPLHYDRASKGRFDVMAGTMDVTIERQRDDSMSRPAPWPARCGPHSRATCGLSSCASLVARHLPYE